MNTIDFATPVLDRQRYRVWWVHTWRQFSLAIIIVLFCNIAPSHVYAATPVQTSATSCPTCASLTDLQGAATGYFLNNYFATGVYQIGSIVLVSGVNNPISAFFSEQWGYSCIPYFGCGTHLVAVAITPDNAHTALLDNTIYQRAAELKPPKLPSTFATNETPELISAYLETEYPIVGGPKLGFNWHLLPGFPIMDYFVLKSVITGQTYDVWLNDEITVTYSNDYTETWQFIGPTLGQGTYFQRVPNTLRDAGGHLVVAVPLGSPATPVNAGFTAPATNWSITVHPPVNFCSAAGAEICIGMPGGNDWNCTVSFIYFPC